MYGCLVPVPQTFSWSDTQLNRGRISPLRFYRTTTYLIVRIILLYWITDFRLVPRSRISGSVPLFPLYAPMARNKEKIFLLGHLRSSGILSGVDWKLPTFRDSLFVQSPREKHTSSFWTARKFTPARPHSMHVFLKHRYQ